MTNIVFNACFGGFGISRAAIIRGREISGNPTWGGTLAGEKYPDSDYTAEFDSCAHNLSRTDPTLIRVIYELKSAANGDCSDLRIAFLVAGTRYRIDDYDGNERVMTIDDYTWEVA